MARTRIHRTYNIPEAIISEAEHHGLDALSTGGGMDYIVKTLGKNEDGSTRVILLCAARESGGPDKLNEPVDVQVMLTETWDNAVAIPCKTAREGMALMAKMYDPYAG